MIFLELFWNFFKIGLFTFGGGYAMLPLIEQVATSHGWLTEREILNFIAVSESTPGPFAVNIATYVGSIVGGTLGKGVIFNFLGSACTTFGVVLPSFAIILAVAKFYTRFKSSKTVSGLMSGIKPAAVGLIISAAVSMGAAVFLPNGFSIKILTDLQFYVSVIIFALCLFLIFYKRKKIPPVLIICISAILGIVAGFIFEL